MRPRKLTRAMLYKAQEYLACARYGDGLPTAADLADYLGVSRATIDVWCRYDDELGEEFAEFYELVKTRQEKHLWNKALSNKWHSGMSQFALANFGYKPDASKDLDRKKLVNEVVLKIEDGRVSVDKAGVDKGLPNDVSITLAEPS